MTFEATPGDERRGEPRVSAQSIHALIVDVEEDGIPVPSSLIPHDISSGGVRGRWERPLPEGRFDLRLEVGDGVETCARVAWQRLLPGGGAIAGVSFDDLDDLSRERLGRYLDALQAPPRRRSPRYADVLPVEVLSGDSSITAIASDVSAEGLQIATDLPLLEATAVTVLAPLTWGVPLELPATVRWRRQTANEGHMAGLEFHPLSPEARASLAAYLDDLTA